MRHVLRVSAGDKVEALEVEEGARLFDALRALDSGSVESPCGGKGLCGKCKIRLVRGELSPPDERESLALSPAEIASGLRLACRARATGDAELEISERGEAIIVVAGPPSAYALDPPVRRFEVLPRAPSLECQADDEARLLAALAGFLPADRAPTRVALEALPALALYSRGGQLSALVGGGEVLELTPARAGARSLGVGVDIGTTTVMCRLVDLGSGAILGTVSRLNAQRSYGADVLSRIAAAEEPGGLEKLRDRIRRQVAEMIAALAEDACARGDCASAEDLVSIALAGNTTMLHLLAGVPPGAIARAPFAPAFLAGRRESAASLGLVRHRACLAFILPGISGYVGADIVAGMAATRLHEAEGNSLYLDLGTNGEIAFGGKGGIICCATAAGPAFEGAGIEKGTGGFEGAIDSAWIEGGSIRCGTIGGQPANGICGSGLIDALAALLDSGIVDETGRMVDADEARALPPGFAELVVQGESGPLAYLDRSRGIYLSQADVRAAQLAKAAIAAGIDTLLRAAGREMGEVSRLYLAGGFGSLLGVRGATRIGLLPPELADRVVVVGNASGAGATSACLSQAALEACSRVSSLCEYVELSGRAEFSASYVERMAFPERG